MLFFHCLPPRTKARPTICPWHPTSNSDCHLSWIKGMIQSSREVGALTYGCPLLGGKAIGRSLFWMTNHRAFLKERTRRLFLRWTLQPSAHLFTPFISRSVGRSSGCRVWASLSSWCWPWHFRPLFPALKSSADSAENLRDGSLRLWMHRLPDGAIAVDTDLAIEGPMPVHSSFNGVQQAGMPQRVFFSQGDESEYQVYQTVALLAAR